MHRWSGYPGKYYWIGMRVERRWPDATPSWKKTRDKEKREKRLGGGKEARNKRECGLGGFPLTVEPVNGSSR